MQPLRIYLAENYFRLTEIQKKLSQSDSEALTCVKKSDELLVKDDKWFFDYGYYLGSTCYLMACLLAQVYRIRLRFLALCLRKNEYKKIIEYVNVLTQLFRKNYGVYQVLQYDIGQLMIDANSQIISYREFCNYVKSRNTMISFYRLFDYCIDIGNGKRTNMLDEIVETIQSFSSCLDSMLNSESIIDSDVKK